MGIRLLEQFKQLVHQTKISDNLNKLNSSMPLVVNNNHKVVGIHSLNKEPCNNNSHINYNLYLINKRHSSTEINHCKNNSR